MRAILSRVFSTQGLRGPVVTLMSGSSVILGIAFLAQPILSRLYTEEQFGVYGYFAFLMAILITFTSLRYEDALMLPEKDRDAGVVVWLGLVVLLFFATLAAVLSIWRTEIAMMARKPAVAPYLLLVPVALLAMRGTKLAELWLTRKRSFRAISASQVANAATMNSSRVAVGFPPISAGTEGLVGGHIAGNMVPLLILGTIIVRRSGKLLRSAFSWREIWSAAKRYRRFPLFSTPSSLTASLVLRAPLFAIPLYFEAREEVITGLFFFAFSNVSIPLSFFSRAVAQVFFVSAVEAHANRRLHVITEGVHRRLVMVMLFPALVILVCGPDIFAVVFGSKWHEAGIYAQYLVPWLFMGSICSPLTRIFDITRRQRLDFTMGLVSFVIVAAALLIGGLSDNIKTFLLCLCLGGCLGRLAQLSVLSNLANVRPSKILAPYVRYLVYSLPGLALMIGALQLGQPRLTLVASVVATAVYGALLLWKEKLFT